MVSTIVQQVYSGLDNSIKAGSGQSGTPDYTASNGVIEVDFYTTGNQVNFKTNGYTFGWTPQNMKYVDENGTEDTIYTVQDVPIDVKANYARFNRPMTDVDDWFIVENNMLKHQILVQGFQRDPVPFLSGEIDFVFGGQVNYDPSLTISVDGFQNVTGTFETAGSINFCDANGNIVYSLPQIVAYDSGIPNRASTTGKYRVTQNSAGVLAFEIVIDNAWFADEARIYPIVIDPTVIVSTAYDITNQGGRKLIKLTNGWLIAAANPSGTATTYFYVSKDNGTTWAQLCFVGGGPQPGQYSLIAGSGTTVYFIYATSGTAYVYLVSFDATTVTNTDQSSTKKTVESVGATYGNLGLSATIDGAGAFHVAMYYTSSQANFYYTKSTDGGNTWSTPQVVSATGQSTLSPCIVVTPSNNPVIAFQQTNGGTGAKPYINAAYLNGSTWTVVNVMGPGVTYPYNAPVLAIDPSGTIHAIAIGQANISGTVYYVVGHSKSTDGGHTWSAVEYAWQGGQIGSATLAIDPTKGDLYVYFESGTGPYNLYQVIYTVSTGTWGTAANLTNYTSGSTGVGAVQSLFAEYNGNSNDAIRYMYSDTNAGALKFGYVSLDLPPNVPLNLSPTGGVAVASLTPTISGTFSDPTTGDTMSAIEVKVYRSSDNTLMWDSTKTAMATTTSNQNWSIQVPASANLQFNVQYYYIVTTWDSSGVQGPWSGNQAFMTEQAPTVTITAPTAGQVINASSVIATLSYSQINNVPQQSFEVQLLDSTGTNVLQDSAVINGTNNAYQFTGLANNTQYQLVAYATTKDGARGTSTKVSFSTSFTQPAAPAVTGSANQTTASITLNWTSNNTPMQIAYCRIYKQVSGSWVLYQDQLPANGSYTDYLVANGIPTIYGLSSMGTNGAESIITSITETPSFTGDWIYDTSSGAQFQFLINRKAYTMETQESRKVFETFATKHMIRRGPLNSKKGTLQALMVNKTQTPMQQLQAFEASFANHPVYYLKTALGDLLKVDLTAPKRNMPVEYLNSQAVELQVDWEEVN